MHRFGRAVTVLGVLLVMVGLVGGFTTMFLNADSWAVNLLMLVPLGFAGLLLGIVITQLHRSAGDN